MSRSLLLSLSAAAALAAGSPVLAQSHAQTSAPGDPQPYASPPSPIQLRPAAYAPETPSVWRERAAVSDWSERSPGVDADAADGDAAPQSGGRSPPPAEPNAPPAAEGPVTSADATPAPGATAEGAQDDPWEGANRRLYGVNRVLDRRLLRPGVVFYHHATPTPIRHGVSNALSNLNEPIIFVNDVLQLRAGNAARSLGRFVLNSVVGFGGFVDVATRAGMPYHNADFGETLGRYGVPTGPYVFIPILGPSTLRDASGRIVDGFADPFNSINYGEARDVLAPTRLVVGGINARDQVDPLLKEIDRTATDPYVTTRSLYLQNRRALVQGGATNAQSVQDLPDFGPAPAAAPPRRTPSQVGPATSGPPSY